jgi:hypothetical protein
MAQYAFTFSSGDTVTPTKLNNARTVSNIVNADISNSAAIAGTKITPNFGSQNVVTTGTLSARNASPSALVHIGSGATDFGQDTLVWVSAPARSTSNAATTPQEVLRLSWQEGNQDLGTGEGCAINFAASLIGDSATFYPVASIASFKEGSADSARESALQFSTSSNGTSAPAERMRITSAGNVGIANTSPAERLHVTGNIKASGFVDADTSFRGQATDSASAPSYCWTGDTNTGMFRPATNTIAFATNGGERVRINSSGNVGIGTTNPSEKLHVVGGSLLNGLITSVPTYDLTTTSAANMAIFSSGTMRRSTSSLRYKQNIEDADSALSQSIVLNARPVWFRSKCDGDNPDWSWWGFIAEEVAELDPRLVQWGTNEDGSLRADGVQYDRFVPHLCAMIQKQQTQIAELSAKVAALEAA